MTRYRNALENIPPPGKGCHAYLLTVANLGVRAKVKAEAMFADIRPNIPSGKRRVFDREIWDAIKKALLDKTGNVFEPKTKEIPIVKDKSAVLASLIRTGKISDDADFWGISPVRLFDHPAQDPVVFLKILFKPDDLVFIGERQQPGIIGTTIRTCDEWVEYYRAGGVSAPFILINPLSGLIAKKKSGDGETLRGDSNIVIYRYCMVEFDNLNREEQLRFWSAVRLPIVALIDSGGKSIHAWLDVQKLAKVDTLEQWNSEIKCRLYNRILAPLGVDAACSNPARLSRLPGHFRGEKGAWQKILWLSPEGRTIT